MGESRSVHLIFSLSFLGGFTFASHFLIKAWGEGIGSTIFALIGMAVFLIAFIRFANKATEIEKIFINDHRLDIIQSSLFKSGKRSFELTDISDFRFLEKEKWEPHPLKGDSIDYLGFQSQQQLIQDLSSEGRASFFYRGRQVRFGKELVSWEFNELEVLLYELTGNDFSKSRSEDVT